MIARGLIVEKLYNSIKVKDVTKKIMFICESHNEVFKTYNVNDRVVIFYLKENIIKNNLTVENDTLTNMTKNENSKDNNEQNENKLNCVTTNINNDIIQNEIKLNPISTNSNDVKNTYSHDAGNTNSIDVGNATKSKNGNITKVNFTDECFIALDSFKQISDLETDKYHDIIGMIHVYRPITATKGSDLMFSLNIRDVKEFIEIKVFLTYLEFQNLKLEYAKNCGNQNNDTVDDSNLFKKGDIVLLRNVKRMNTRMGNVKSAFGIMLKPVVIKLMSDYKGYFYDLSNELKHTKKNSNVSTAMDFIVSSQSINNIMLNNKSMNNTAIGNQSMNNTAISNQSMNNTAISNQSMNNITIDNQSINNTSIVNNITKIKDKTIYNFIQNKAIFVENAVSQYLYDNLEFIYFSNMISSRKSVQIKDLKDQSFFNIFGKVISCDYDIVPTICIADFTQNSRLINENNRSINSNKINHSDNKVATIDINNTTNSYSMILSIKLFGHHAYLIDKITVGSYYYFMNIRMNSFNPILMAYMHDSLEGDIIEVKEEFVLPYFKLKSTQFDQITKSNKENNIENIIDNTNQRISYMDKNSNENSSIPKKTNFNVSLTSSNIKKRCLESDQCLETDRCLETDQCIASDHCSHTNTFFDKPNSEVDSSLVMIEDIESEEHIEEKDIKENSDDCLNSNDTIETITIASLSSCNKEKNSNAINGCKIEKDVNFISGFNNDFSNDFNREKNSNDNNKDRNDNNSNNSNSNRNDNKDRSISNSNDNPINSNSNSAGSEIFSIILENVNTLNSIDKNNTSFEALISKHLPISQICNVQCTGIYLILCLFKSIKYNGNQLVLNVIENKQEYCFKVKRVLQNKLQKKCLDVLLTNKDSGSDMKQNVMDSVVNSNKTDDVNANNSIVYNGNLPTNKIKLIGNEFKCLCLKLHESEIFLVEIFFNDNDFMDFAKYYINAVAL